jgi:glycolate dehydrogenase FAD-linked subunit
MMLRSRQIATSYGLDAMIVGHAGDGNLHPVLFYDPSRLDAVETAAEAIATAALELGGTLTGEHGVGTAKKDLMHRVFRPVELATFRAIKNAFDPDHLLNPGVLLPAPQGPEPDLTEFGAAVASALAGRRTPSAMPRPPSDADIVIDADNMSLAAGGAARCRDVAAAARSAGLVCATMDCDGDVADVVEAVGHRQPARGALLGVEAVLPGGHCATFGSAAMKDVAGLDAKRLIAGGAGAFGRLTRVVLRALPGG